MKTQINELKNLQNILKNKVQLKKYFDDEECEDLWEDGNLGQYLNSNRVKKQPGIEKIYTPQ